MGQPNAKDSKPRRIPANMRTRPQPAAVRPSAVNDAVLQTISGAAGSPPSAHIDPATSDSRTLSGSPSSAIPSNMAEVAPSISATYPVVLRYADKDVRGLIERKKHMYVMVEAMNWQPLPMSPSTDSFYALLELPAGNHNYRFMVDGTEVVDSTQPLAPSKDAPVPVVNHSLAAPSATPAAAPPPRPLPARDGQPANVIFLNDAILDAKADDDAIGEEDGWGQDAVMFEESRKYPPIVPLHLRYTPLNTPPTLVRCSRDGRMAVVDNGGDQENRMPPEHLPLPLSVTINHVYFQRREDHAVMGVTTRYGNKFTTIAYYTHLPSTTEGTHTAKA